jgi:hypothetical protein
VLECMSVHSVEISHVSDIRQHKAAVWLLLNGFDFACSVIFRLTRLDTLNLNLKLALHTISTLGSLLLHFHCRPYERTAFIATSRLTVLCLMDTISLFALYYLLYLLLSHRSGLNFVYIGAITYWSLQLKVNKDVFPQFGFEQL